MPGAEAGSSAGAGSSPRSAGHVVASGAFHTQDRSAVVGSIDWVHGKVGQQTQAGG